VLSFSVRVRGKFFFTSISSLSILSPTSASHCRIHSIPTFLPSQFLTFFFPPSASVPRHSPFLLGRRRVPLPTSLSSVLSLPSSSFRIPHSDFGIPISHLLTLSISHLLFFRLRHSHFPPSYPLNFLPSFFRLPHSDFRIQPLLSSVFFIKQPARYLMPCGDFHLRRIGFTANRFGIFTARCKTATPGKIEKTRRLPFN
jgi:hypothetical protein